MEEKIEEYSEQTRIFRIMKEAIPFIVIIIVVVLIRTFIITPVRVNGASMEPTLNEGEILILNKLKTSFRRFDVVVVNVHDSKIIKRVIGLPGEVVSYRDCQLYINGLPVEDFVTECITDDFSLENLYNYLTIPAGHYFVMGDNRTESSDSRDSRIGLVNTKQLEGTTIFRVFPFNKIGRVR